MAYEKRNYSHVKNLTELKFEQRLIKTEIKNREEVLLSQVEEIKDMISPVRFMNDLLMKLVSYSPVIEIAVKSFNFVRSLIHHDDEDKCEVEDECDDNDSE